MDLKSRNKATAEFNLSSMTDIVFLLLIFFMLISTLVTTNLKNVDLPKSESQTLAKQSVSVSIDKDLNFYVNQELTVKEDIAIRITEELAKLQVDKENENVVLNCDKTVPYKYISEVMEIVNKLELKMIIATKP